MRSALRELLAAVRSLVSGSPRAEEDRETAWLASEESRQIKEVKERLDRVRDQLADYHRGN